MRTSCTSRIVVRMLVFGALAALAQVLLATTGVVEMEPLWSTHWYTF